MNPIGERIAESRMHFGHPVDVDNGLCGLTGFVRLGPRAITLGTLTSDADHRGHCLRMFDRVAHTQITTPRMAYHDPGADTDRLTNAFEISDCFFHGVRAAARAANAARFGVPGAVVQRRDLVPFQILHTTRSAGQDDDVRPVARYTNVQRGSSYLNHPRLHVRERYQQPSAGNTVCVVMDSMDVLGVRPARSFVCRNEVHSVIKLYGTNRITTLLYGSLNGQLFWPSVGA
jgi:hypothetical protein